MKIKKLFALLCVLPLSSSLFAQIDALEADPGIEVSRDAVAVNDVLTRRPVDPDFINTAIVLTDSGARPSVTYCVAYNHQGQPIGRAHTKTPGNGVRVILASDLTHGLDFVGKVRCRSRDRVQGTAFIVGPGNNITDTAVKNLQDRAGSLISIPVAVSR